MSRADHDRLNRLAERQLDGIGMASGARYVAQRMEILDAAIGWLEKNDFDAPDVLDVTLIAGFLAGDRTEN